MNRFSLVLAYAFVWLNGRQAMAQQPDSTAEILQIYSVTIRDVLTSPSQQAILAPAAVALDPYLRPGPMPPPEHDMPPFSPSLPISLFSLLSSL